MEILRSLQDIPTKLRTPLALGAGSAVLAAAVGCAPVSPPGAPGFDCQVSNVTFGKVLVEGTGTPPHIDLVGKATLYCASKPQSLTGTLAIQQTERAHVSAKRKWRGIAITPLTLPPVDFDVVFTVETPCRTGRFRTLATVGGTSSTGVTQGPVPVPSSEQRVGTCRV